MRSLYGEEASLVHRIDKETSGLVLVGKHSRSITKLGAMFANHHITKEYLALVRGDLSKSNWRGRDFCLSLPLATQPKGGDLCVRSKFLGQSEAESLSFREAKSEFEMLGVLDFCLQKSFGGDSNLQTVPCTLLKVRPKSGRTHQIRLHLYALGFPILGDPLYGALDVHSREYLDAEFIPAKSQNLSRDSLYGLSNRRREIYFGATRLMLHAYHLKFNFEGKTYDFQSSKTFEIPFS